MPKTWQNTRARQLAMQGIMWLILGGAVGIASLTDRALHTSGGIALGPAIEAGPVSYRLPEHWTVSVATDFGASARQAADPDDSEHKVTVILQRVDHLMAPLIYLQRTDQLPDGVGSVVLEPLLLKGFPAQMARWVSAGQDGGTRSIIACCVMLPSLQAMTIRLERGDAFEESDQQLLEQVLTSVTISGPAPSHVGPIQLNNGIQITPAADFTVYPQTDPLRTDRTMIRQTTNGGWISAQCVPMVMGNLPAGSLRGAILNLDPVDPRDPGPAANWVNADVTQIDNTHWRIDPHDSPEGWMHRRAYVTASDAGPAMLVLLKAHNPAGETDLDQAYADLQIKIPTKTVSNADALLAAGAGAVSALSAAHRSSGEQWWLWQRQGIAEGSTRSYLDTTGQLAVRETTRRDWQGLICRVTQRWGTAWARTERFDIPDQPTFVVETRNSDQISTTVQLNGQDMENKVPESPAMVSGARLPELLAGLANSPVAIWTDHFPGYEDQPSPSPLLVVLRPLQLDGHGRGVEAEVNGTGQLSRWYFAADGTFEHADYAGGVSLQPSTLAEIISATQSDPRLTPVRQQPTMDSGSPPSNAD
jgi:hypothetical protein